MAAKAKTATTSIHSLSKTKKKRPGVHSKKKSSGLKSSKNYKKLYRGQLTATHIDHQIRPT
jgi:hypothetical protein